MVVPAHIPGLHSMASTFTGSPSTLGKTSRGAIDALEMRIDRQHMVIQTLLMLLLEKKLIEEDEFREWLNYVDNLDGRADGKLRPEAAPRACPACGRNNSPTAPRCQYCGRDFPEEFIDGRHKRQ
jgi:hypothetical protein